MNILITGAKGTIGKMLFKHLDKEHNVIPTDIDDLDVTNKISDSFKNANMVIHLAAEVSRLGGELYPDNTLNTNILGTYNVVRFCLANKIKLINFSTSEIYGDIPFARELFEDMQYVDSKGPTNVYGISKLCAENVVKHYAQNYRLQSVTVRPFMVYGEGEYPTPYRSAISQFIDNALKSKPFQVHKGTRRAWCYIDDFCEAIKRIAENNETFDQYTVYNIGMDQPIPTESVAKLVIQLTGADNSLIQLVDPPKQFLSPIKLGNFDKIRTTLGFEAKIPIEEGIKKTIDWQRSLCNQK